MRRVRATFFIVGIGNLLLSAGCGGGSSSTPSFSNTSPPSSSITSVAVTCSPSSIQENQTSKCSGTVSGTGNFSSGVTWSVDNGTIDQSGNYTPPQTATTATVKATSNQDSSKLGTANISVIAGWSSFYAPPNGNATAGGAVFIDSLNDIVVSDAESIPNSSTDTTAGVVIFDSNAVPLQTWSNSPVPSSVAVNGLALSPSGNSFFAAGKTGGSNANPSLWSGWLTKLPLPGSSDAGWAIKFQIGGQQTEAVAVCIFNGQIFVGVKTIGANSGDSILIFDLQGNNVGGFSVGNSGVAGLTGMFVTDVGLVLPEAQIVLTGNTEDANGDVTGSYLQHYVFDPNLQLLLTETGGAARDVIPTGNTAGFFSAGSWVFNPNSIAFFVIGYDENLLPVNTTASGWNGDNTGAVSVNRAMNVFANPFNGGVVAVGSLSQIGSSDPNQTDAGAFAANPTSSCGGNCAIQWKQRFGIGSIPGGTVSIWNSGIFDSQDNLILVGTGTDGRTSCGESSCQTVVVFKTPNPIP